MIDDLKLGDRVTVTNGDCATVLDIDGVHIYMRLDSKRHMSALIGSLTKIVGDVKDNGPHDLAP